jgi:hypothetical protein
MKLKIFSILFFFIVIFSANYANAQILNFCEGIDDFGNPIESSSVFNLNSEGGYLYFLVRLQEPLGCDYANYKLYEVDYNGNESYNTTIEQVDINPIWRWFWKKVTFYRAGTYMVYVEDCNGNVITSSQITIKIK